jgi:hypothetical protein
MRNYMVTKAYLTDKTVRDLKPSERGEYSVYDSKQKGFAVRVRASGGKTFVAVCGPRQTMAIRMT